MKPISGNPPLMEPSPFIVKYSEKSTPDNKIQIERWLNSVGCRIILVLERAFIVLMDRENAEALKRKQGIAMVGGVRIRKRQIKVIRRQSN